ncbi:murein biosynthesis integral membrane protein MurJ [uncultured Clostridium sp.]|uniref:murein biosynthesis integral membrane protein MurJ n=1 Tax=uncultured Clostridium sp. TaxID=59620 RepID=UPI00345C176C
MNSRKIGRAVSSVVVFTLIAKLLGFFREVLLSYFFGASGISDAYLISQNIPGTIFQFVGTGLTTCFIPVFFRVHNKEGKEKADIFTNTLISIVLFFSTAVIALIWAFTPQVVKVFASGFSGNTLWYAVWFTRIGVLSLYFSTIIYIYNSYLQANKIFGPTAFAAIPNSLCIMASIALGAKLNIWLLPVGSCLAVGVQMLFLVIPVHKLKFRLRLNLNWKDKYVKQFFELIVPVILGVSVNQVNTLVDRTVASQVAVGGISALTYANSLIMFVQGGLVDPINTVFYPQITESVASNDNAGARRAVEKVLNYVLTLLIPITAGFIVFRHLITDSLFGRGAFDTTASAMTSEALCFYAVGICFIGIREMLSRFYYAHSNTRIPMRNSIIGVVINITMNLLLSRFWGIAGLAIATSISAAVTAILLWGECDKHLHCGSIIISIKDLLKTTFSAAVAIVAAYFVIQHLNLANLLELIIAVLISVLVYCVMGFAIRIELFVVAKEILKDRLKKR